MECSCNRHRCVVASESRARSVLTAFALLKLGIAIGSDQGAASSFACLANLCDYCQRKGTVSTYPFLDILSILVKFWSPSVSELGLSLSLFLTLTYLQFYPLAGAQHFALQVERAALFGIVLVE